jgi:CheY-like chemotaxis protein/CRP-like cAMP-binding protein
MKKTILIIDDHLDIRENTAEILEMAGFNVLKADDGKPGVDLAINSVPDLIICDIMMPGLDGYGVLHLLRNNPVTEHIPFIFLTAKTERTDLRKGMEMGADDYITKPFDDIELLHALETRFKKQDIYHKKYKLEEHGLSMLINDLSNSGILDFDLDQYETEQYSRKQILYNEGKRPRNLYYLKSGKIKTYRSNDEGKEYITSFHAKDEYIGYVPLFENVNYADTAEFIDEGEVVIIPKDDFLNKVYGDLRIATKFIKLISQELAEKEERMLVLAYDSLRKRIAKSLLEIQEKFDKENLTMTHSITREDFARYVGTATESLIRTLSDFKAEKLIEINEGKIQIINKEKLSHLLY